MKSLQLRSGRVRPVLLLSLSLLALASQLPLALPAQEAESDGETLVLSPFEVLSAEDRGYAATGALGGTRFRGVAAAPMVPVTIIRKADAVVIEFALSNGADKQDQRNQELTTSVELIAQAIKATPGLRFENREVQLATGNRSRSIIGKGGAVTSFANFAVFATIGDDIRLYERVKQVRGLVSAAKLAGATKVLDGPVGLYVKRPNDVRGEILAKIFADLDVVRKGLGADCDLLVSGLGGPVQLRACSESEVELWIDYSFAIRSLHEMDLKRPVVRS